MQLFYQRYGKEKLFKDANDAKATKQTAHDISFTEFVKHGPSPPDRRPCHPPWACSDSCCVLGSDEQFYTVSRQITDSKRAQEQAGEEELSPSEQLSARRPKPTRYQVRQQDPNRLRKRRHRTLADPDGGSDGGESAEWDDDGVDARVPRRDDPERQVQDEEYRGVIDTNADKTPFAAAVSALKVADKAAKEAADNDFEARWAAVRLYEEGMRLIDVAVEAKDEGDQDALNDMLIGGTPTPLSPLFLRRFPPVLRRAFAVLSALSGFLAPRRRERAKNGEKWAKFGGETGEKQRWLSGVGHSVDNTEGEGEEADRETDPASRARVRSAPASISFSELASCALPVA